MTHTAVAQTPPRTLALQALLGFAVAALALAGLGGFFHSRPARAQAD